MKTNLLSLLIVVLISALPGYAQKPGEPKLVGQVVDSYERVPISRAFVVIHREGRQGDQVVTVDSKGKYEVELVPGYYDVMVGANEFAPACKRVEILDGKTVHFNPKLSPDSEHLEQTLAH